MPAVFRVKPYAHSEYKFVVRAKIDGKWRRRYFRTIDEAQQFADEQNRAAVPPAHDSDIAAPRVTALHARRAIVILGMHRSGTSAVAGALGRAGVPFGDRLMPPAEDNEKGFWEHVEIVRLHDQLLSRLGSSWDDECPLPPEWETHEATREAQATLADIVERDFARERIFAFKDPRLSRLLPLWIPLFRRLQIEPYFVLMMRHPWEVAQSLVRRNSFPPSKSYLLWLRHTFTAELATREYPRTILTYEDLLRAPADVIARILTAVGFVRDPGLLEGTLRTAVEPSMQHHSVAGVAAASGVPPFVLGVYETIVGSADSRASSSRVDALRERFSEVAQVYDANLSGRSHALDQELRTTRQLTASLEEQREEAARVLDDLQRENDRKTQHIGSLDAQILSLSDQLAEQRRDAARVLEDLQRENDRKSEHIGTLDAHILSLSRELEDRRARFARFRSRYAARLLEARRNASAEAERNATDLIDARWEVLTLRADAIRGNDRAADAVAKFHDSENRVSAVTSERDQLRHMVIALTQDIEQERLNVLALQHRYAAAEISESAARDESSAVLSRFAEVEAARDSALARLEDSEQRIRELEQELYAAEDKSRAAETSLLSSNRRAAATEDQLQSVQEQWAETRHRLQLATDELAGKRSQLREIRRQLGQRLILPVGKVQHRIYELTK